MSDEFNPYHKWLGIPLSEQPADHYRLLGIARFESDLDVITGASDQRMQFLRTLQTGKRGKLVDKLLNEIANAKVCLLNKEKKIRYDETLRKKSAAKKQEEQAPLFQTDAESESRRRGRTPSRGRTTKRGRREPKENKSGKRSYGLFIGGTAIAVILLIGVFLLLSNRAKKQEITRQAAIAEKQATEKAKADAQQRELDAARARAEAAEQKLKAQEDATEARTRAEKEAERKAEAEREAAEAERQARIESARKTRERANRAVEDRKAAYRLLIGRGLQPIHGTWRFSSLETEWFQLQTMRQIPREEAKAWTNDFMKQYRRTMNDEFYRRSGVKPSSPLDSPIVGNADPIKINSKWMQFMAAHHPDIDSQAFAITKGSPQPFLARAMVEAFVHQMMIRNHANPSRSESNEAELSDAERQLRAQAILNQIAVSYQQLEEDTEIQMALGMLSNRLGDPLIDLTLIQPIADSAPSSASASGLNGEIATKTDNRKSTKGQQKAISKEQRAKAIKILKQEGLTSSREGWIPEDLGNRLKDLEKEVEFIQEKGWTPKQDGEIKREMNIRYNQKFNEWKNLNTKGLARARAKGFDDEMISLPIDEARRHRYLSMNLLAPKGFNDPPNAPRKLSPNAVMQRDTENEAIQILVQKNRRYREIPKAALSKNKKYIKTLEKKIRMRLRDLQKKPEVEQALSTLNSKFDPRFLPSKN